MNRSKRLCIALALLLMCGVLGTYFVRPGPCSGVDLEMFAGYEKARLHGDIVAILVMDKSLSTDFRMPYLGWPPLYGLLLSIPALLGLPYLQGVFLLNTLLLIFTAYIGKRCLNLAGTAGIGCRVGLSILFAIPLLRMMTMGFCHWLIPISLFLAPLALESGASPSTKGWRNFVPAVAFGLFCGLSNWLSYFCLPALAVTEILRWRAERRQNPIVASSRLKRSAAWILAAGIVAIVMFAGWRLFYHVIIRGDRVVNLALSGNSDTLHRRMFPGAQGWVQALFFAFLRFLVALLPLLIVYLAGVLTGVWTKCRPTLGAMLNVLPLWISPLGFFLVFPGEMAPAAHTFHSMAFVPAVSSLWIFVKSGPRTGRSWIPALAGLLVALFVLEGDRILPASMVSSFSLPPRALGNSLDAVAPPRKNSAIQSICRTAMKQLFAIREGSRPVDSPEGLFLTPHEFALHAGSLIGNEGSSDHVYFTPLGDSRSLTYILNRTVIGTKDPDELESELKILASIAPRSRPVVILLESGDFPVPQGTPVIRIPGGSTLGP